MGTVAYAVQSVNDRIEIDNENDNITVNTDDAFGYQIEAIGDLDLDGVIDLAVISFEDDTEATDLGAIVILFMNADGSVKKTNEIIMDESANGLNNAACLIGDGTNRDTRGLEQLAFVGDLDGDGTPTIALGANSNNHDTGGGVIANTGAVYMLELLTTGKVDTCVLITENNGNFDPADGVYIQDGTSNFGWPVIATDLDGDGQNELLVGANAESDVQTDLWPLFLNGDGTVKNHPATPISGATIGIDASEYIDDGASINGGTKIVVSNTGDGDGGGSVFIVNLSATGAFVSATEIAGSTIAGIANDESFGSGVAGLGDMDNDGINDIIVGNIAGDDTNALSGEAHIIYLNADDSLKESQKISNESENTRVGATPFAANDFLGEGMALWRDSGSNAVIAIGAHGDDTGGALSGAIHLFYVTRTSSTVTAETGGGSDDGAHNTKPTFGLDHKTFEQKVTDGLIMNGVAFTVDDNFWTKIPMQYMPIGEMQNFTAKMYAPKELHVMEFLFGIPELGDWNKAEASVELHFDFAGEFTGQVINDDDLLFNQTSISFSKTKAFCTDDDIVEQCIKVSIELEFNEAPIGKILALQAIDHKRRSNILYFNDGITLEGESKNPPTIQYIISEIKYKGLQTVQRIDKEHDIWQSMDKSEPVRLYQQNDFGTFIPIEYRTFDVIPDIIRTYTDRGHSEFYRFLDYEIKRATEIFDSRIIQKELPK